MSDRPYQVDYSSADNVYLLIREILLEVNAQDFDHESINWADLSCTEVGIDGDVITMRCLNPCRKKKCQNRINELNLFVRC